MLQLLPKLGAQMETNVRSMLRLLSGYDLTIPEHSQGEILSLATPRSGRQALPKKFGNFCKLKTGRTWCTCTGLCPRR
jgi:hypothetical protein